MGKLSPYATPSATREVLERHGLYTKYGLGQNFLVNDDIIRKILELADVQPTDHILEVGPGIGTLTYPLLQHAAGVLAIEKDPDLSPVLMETTQGTSGMFTLMPADALDVTAQQIQDVSVDAQGVMLLGLSIEEATHLPNKLVSNLPYAVAATVVLDYLQNFDFLQSATVMVQKEVADRMMAQPGSKSYGAYTVKLSLYAQPAGRFPVSPGNFFPPPHVESTVLRLNRIIATDADGHTLTPEQLAATCTMADAAFATRRKTLANSCKTYFSGDSATLERLPQIFEAAGIDPKRRGETLTRDEFITLGNALLLAHGA